MFTLALLASLIFFLVSFYGILIFILSGINAAPNFLIVILGIIGILIGLWWILLPIGIGAKLAGTLTIFLSGLSIKNRY